MMTTLLRRQIARQSRPLRRVRGLTPRERWHFVAREAKSEAACIRAVSAPILAGGTI